MTDAHWDTFYVERDPAGLGWYEPVPSTLPLVVANSTPADAVIDVGAGTSRLLAELLARGYTDLTALDLSATAIECGRRQLGAEVDSVCWIHADLRALAARRRWALWHDRAVYHFLIDVDDRAAYRRVAASAIVPSGILVVATFGPAGPLRCAGLPVRRYDEASLASEFAADFDVVTTTPLVPASDVGDQRPYVAAVLRRR